MIDMKEYGIDESIEVVEGRIPARITAVHRELFEIVCRYGACHAVVKSSIYYDERNIETFPAIGDFVLIEYNPSGPSRIIKTLERKSYFSRRDPDVGRGEQIVAANFDYVFIVMSLNNDFNTKRLERYLAASWQSGATPLIILTKTDLLEDYSDYINELEQVAIGVEIIPISSMTGFGLEGLKRFIEPGKTIVFLGSSGVGKSSLVNALVGESLMKTNSIREDDAKGHHTTTHRQLIRLSNGAMIIDTPGMRELGVWDISVGLEEAFQDIKELILDCRFSDCTHGNEPGCKIREALQGGTLEEERWRRYLKLKREAKYSEAKVAYKEREQKKGKVYSKKDKKFKGLYQKGFMNL